jgi:hypothetical protein
MTKEEKELLLKTICGYFPHGLKSTVVKFDDNDGSEYYTDCEILGIRRNQLVEFIKLKDNKEVGRSDWNDISLFKPYLRPMSSMTEKEMSELRQWGCLCMTPDNRVEDVGVYGAIHSIPVIDWLNAHHFDYRGLIPMGLALEAPKDMYKID